MAGSPYAIVITNGSESGSGLDNYDVSYVDGALTVNKAALTVTANDDTKVYDAVAYSGGNGVSYSGFVNGENEGVLGGSVVYGGSSQGAVNVGTYDITASGLTSDNYDISYDPGQLSITTAALLLVAADNQSKTYGSTFTFNGTEFSTTGLLGGDTVTGADITSDGAVSTATVGDYDIDISNATGTGLSNYTIQYQKGTFTVNKADLELTADSTSKIYGDTKTFNGTEFSVTNGTLFNGDTVDSVALTSAGADASADVAGSPYAIVITNGSESGSGLDNYNVTYVDGALTVNPARLLVTADDKAKVYGDADPALTYQVTGLKNGDLVGDVFSGDLTRDPGEDVGPVYAITQGSLGLTSSNYDIASFTNGQLVISPRELIVAADPKTKVFGNPDPALTYQTSGLQFGDTAGSVLSGDLTRDPGEDVGAYAITQGTVGLTSQNYFLTYVGNTLTITPLAPAPNPEVPFIAFDPLGRPIISVANQAIVLDEPFEPVEVLDVNTDVSIAANGPATPEVLAGLTPAAGGEGQTVAEQVAAVEPAAGGNEEGGQAQEDDENDLSCANAFFENKPCRADRP